MKLIHLILLMTVCVCLYSQEFNLEKTFNNDISAEERKQVKQSIYNHSQEIKINPQNPYNYINRGICYANLGLYPDAISDYNRALKIDTTIPEAYFNRGIARARFRYTKTACLDIKKAHTLGLATAKNTYDKNCGLYKNVLGEIK